MTDGSLRRFLERLGFKRVEGEVDPLYGVTRLLATGEGPLVFKVQGSPIECAGNVVASREAVLKALSASSDVEAYEKLLKSMSSPAPLKISGTPRLKKAPRGLYDSPAVKFYEGDGGPYLTSAIFVACWKDVCNASIHRVMVVGEREGRVRVVPRHLWRLYRDAVSEGSDLPVTVVLGVHPAILLASASSPRLGIFEFEVASTLLGGLEAFESPVHGNPVPMGAGVLIEGWLTKESAPEGPFVDATGTLDVVRDQPIFKVKAVYYDPDQVSHVILPAGREHAMLMGFPREAQIWATVSRVVPKVHAVRLTPASGGWLHAVISIEKSHDGDAKNAIMAAFAGHPSLKHVVIVDPDIDVDDPRDVEWAIATRFQADRDLVIIRNARGSTLDPSAPTGLTTKLGIDATKPLGREAEYEKATRIPGQGVIKVR